MAQKIAILGLGYWGKNILRNLVELKCDIVACDPHAATIEQRKKEFPAVTYSQDFNKVLTDKTIPAVIIAAPAVMHYDLVKQALTSGKDVFVEKPLALQAGDGQELVALAKAKKRILMVGHILHYHPAVIHLKEMLRKGDLGQIQYIYSNRLNIGKLRSEENILWSFAPHDISLILSLVGEEPTAVHSFGESYLNEGVWDTTITHLEFKSKVRAHIFVSWLHPFKEQKLVVVGSKAMAVFDDVSKEKLLIYPHTIEWKPGKIPVANKAEAIAIPLPQAEPLKEELKHFFHCIATRSKPMSDGEEGLRVLKVLQSSDNKSNAGYFLHPTSVVDSPSTIGKGTKIWHYCHVSKDASLGKNCILGQNVFVGPGVKIGNNVKIQNNVSVYNGVTLEDDVFCGPSCVFTNVYTPRAFVERKDEFLPITVKKGATIGANATIVCGVTVGRYAFIGAGSVVKADVPDHAVIVGVPGTQKGWACKCGEILKSKALTCTKCKSKYKITKGQLTPVKETL